MVAQSQNLGAGGSVLFVCEGFIQPQVRFWLGQLDFPQIKQQNGIHQLYSHRENKSMYCSEYLLSLALFLLQFLVQNTSVFSSAFELWAPAAGAGVVLPVARCFKILSLSCLAPVLTGCTVPLLVTALPCCYYPFVFPLCSLGASL